MPSPPVTLPLGHALYESGSELHHVYFPTIAIASLLYVMIDGASAEIAMVGNQASSGSPCSWEATRCPTGPSCRAPATPAG